MKTKLKLFGLMATLVAFMTSTFHVAAQSKSLPIDSLASAVSHNELLIRQVYGSLYSTSLLNTNGSRTFWSQGYSPNGVPRLADLVSIVATNPFAFLIARPSNDWVSVYVSYNSSSGDQLFWAPAGFQLTKSNGVWTVPESARTSLEHYIGYYEPLYETNALAAHLNLRDGSGNILQVVYLEVYWDPAARVGKIMNQTQYLGQHGELVVTYGQFDQYGNATNSFDIAFALDEDKGGVALVPASVKASFQSQWSGLIVPLSPPNIILTNVPSVNHIGTSPLVEVTITNTMAVYVSAVTSEGEVANGFTLKLLQAGADNSPTLYTYPSVGLWIILYPGVYHIDFTWPQLAPQQITPWWYYGGGKG